MGDFDLPGDDYSGCEPVGDQDFLEELAKDRGIALPTLPFPELTDREREVALRLAVGEGNHEIAAALEISAKTIDTHRGHILKKLACRHNVDLARLALRKGYVTL